MDVIDAPVSGDAVIDSLVEGPIWAGTTLTYSFPTQAQFTGYTGGEPYNNFQVFNATQIAAARAAFNMITSFTGLTFQQVTGTSAGDATIRFGMSDDPDTAYAYMPNSDPMGGDAWFNNTSGNYDDPVRGNYAWQSIMHEIGHALGLGHPHESNPPMDLAHDWLAYTVMSYRSYEGAGTDGGFTNGDWGFPQSYMMEDIAALQFLYGANYNFRSSNTTYTWNPDTGEMSVNGVGQGAPGSNAIFLTIWDGGGIDTYDFSSFSSNARIDLRPGAWNYLDYQHLAQLGGGNVPPGEVANSLLYNGDTRSLIENAIGTSGGDIINGNDVANHLSGGAGDDTIYGHGGNDVLDGGPDSNTLYGDEGDDVLNGGTGRNEMYGGDGADILNGGAGGNSLNGDAGADHLYGNVGSDALNGGDGADFMTGGDNNDYLTGGADNDTVHGDAGNDDVFGDGGADSLDGGTGDDNLYGGEGNDVLTGGDGNDHLYGGAGADRMVGGAGDDYYVVDDTSDVVVENADGGVDTVITPYGYVLPSVIENGGLSGIGNVSISGNNLDNILSGNQGNNVIDGGAGADHMRGSYGNDTYYVDNAGDWVFDGGPDGGTDTIYSSVTYALIERDPSFDPYAGASIRPWSDGDNHIELLVLTGSANLNGTGNGFDNTITGNSGANLLSGKAGNDTLDGGAGVDRMVGGVGDDTYFVDRANDVVTEYADEGTDTVNASDSYRLGANVENLVLDGTAALNGTGNGSANVLTGNSGANVLTGNGGNDTLTGGLGNDTLNGGVGDDVLSGGGGADTAVYVGLPGGVTVSLAVSGAQNTGAGGVDALSGIENLIGTGYGDTLTGNAAANTLDGGGGADTLTGGAGNDTYWVNLMADVVVEQAGQGTDTVHAAGNYALSDNVENLILEGTLNLSGTGNALANRLTGNSGNNVLDGLAGADWMAGGLGNDTYRVDNASDVVVERSGGGTDTVLASATFTLAGETENLTLTGAAAIAGTGNGYANTLTGNAAANALNGMGGADTLNGGGGGDTLDGGNGNDVLNGGAWRDFLTGGYGADSFVFNLASDTGTSQRDSIEDFSHAQHDLIDLSAIDAIAGGADDAFTVTDTFHHVAGELAVSLLATGHYLVRGDTNGDGLADFGIDVYSATALTSADFVL